MVIIDKQKIIDELNDTLNNYSKTVSDKRDYLGMSEIGDACERRLWYKFRNFTINPFSNRIKRLFDLGNFIEYQTIKDLIDLNYIVNDCQKEILDFNNFFRGHIDGIIELYDYKFVLECKSSNSKYFNSIKKNGFENFLYYSKYYDQAQCYMGYLKIENCLFAICCKDTSELYFELIKFDNERFEYLKQKAQHILLSNIAPPPIIEENKYYFKTECKWCDYSILCKDTEIYTMNEIDKKCLNCIYYLIVPGIFKSICRHPNHPYYINGELLCKDYINLYEKTKEPIKMVKINEVRDYENQ